MLADSRSRPDPEVRALRDHSRRLARAFGLMRSRADETGCTPAQIHVLLEIARGGPLTTLDVARLLGIDKSTASRSLQTLVDGGELERTVDPDDQRVRPLRLTPRGRSTVRRIDRAGDAIVERTLALLTADERARLLDGVRLYDEAIARARAEAGCLDAPDPE